MSWPQLEVKKYKKKRELSQQPPKPTLKKPKDYHRQQPTNRHSTLIRLYKSYIRSLFDYGAPIDLFTDSDAIFEKSIPQCIMGYPGYMCIRREVNKL